MFCGAKLSGKALGAWLAINAALAITLIILKG